MKHFSSFPFPLYSVLIWQRGRVLAEEYYAPYSPDRLHRMFSVTKSFTALAVGGLIAEGRLKPDDCIVDYFPEYAPAAPHPYLAAMTIRDMLTMRTCHKATTYKINMAENWVRSFFVTSPDHRPGTVFKYDTSSAHTLAALVRKVSGRGVLDYLRSIFPEELPLSPDAYILTDPFGSELGGSGLLARPRDLLNVSKFLLSLKKGTWQADYPSLSARDAAFYERFAAYVSEAHSCLVPTVHQGKTEDEWQGYGFQFWQVRDGVMMYGMGGQYAVIYPDIDLIVVTTADSQAVQGGTQMILDAVHKTYLDLGGNENLSHRVTLCGLTEKAPLPETFAGRWTFAENPQGFEYCDITGRELVLVNRGERFSFPLEHDPAEPFACTKEPRYGQDLRIWSSVMADGSLYLYAQIFGEYLGSIRMLLSVSEDRLTLHMNRIEETVLREFDGFLEGRRGRF